MQTDGVTGAVAEVEMLAGLPVEQVWRLVADVTRIGEWSPECVAAAWRPGEEPGPDGTPRTGATFDGRNDYGHGVQDPVECVVTEVVPRSVFEYVVLDDDRDVTRPGSIWRYELAPAAGGTLIRQRFTHGSGLTGVREGTIVHPDRAGAIVANRLAVLHRNMTTTITRMTDPEGTTR